MDRAPAHAVWSSYHDEPCHACRVAPAERIRTVIFKSSAWPGLRSSTIGFFLLAAGLTAAHTCQAGEFYDALSLEGFTGILNTPTAEVTRQGHVSALYSNQREESLRGTVRFEDSYLFSIGLFDCLEVGGRATEAPPSVRKGGLRDLSGNFKLRVPFIPRGGYLPQVAIGMQDAAGGGTKLQTKYLVASEELWRLRFSLGYGSGPKRMEGVFGGAEIKALDWLYLLAENDTKETNIGLRLVTPEVFGIPVQLQATVKTSLDHNPGSPEFGVGLQFPLGFRHHNRTPALIVPPRQEPPTPIPSEPHALKAPETITPGTLPVRAEDAGLASERRLALLGILARLADDGFQNLQVGEGEPRTLVVEYENSRYNHNELDGIGVVAGIVAQAPSAGFRTVRLVLKKKGIRILELQAPLADLTDFLADAGALERLRSTLQVTRDISDTAGVQYVEGPANPSWLRPTLILAPSLQAYVATDVSFFDSIVSLKPELLVPVWKGALIDARWNLPLLWSSNFEDRKPFRASRQDPGLERLMLFQTVRLAPTLMATLGAGEVVHHSYGTLNELFWTPGDASHRFGLRQAYAEGTGTTDTSNRLFLGSYRYRYDPLDLALEVTGGRFFNNDNGALVELRRFFGDTAFSVYYKDVETSQNLHVKAGGVKVTLPLTPRRDLKATVAQVTGASNWSYGQETTIATGGGNVLTPGLASVPIPAYNISDTFYNRDRLSEGYIKGNLLRLRDAYLRYVVR